MAREARIQKSFKTGRGVYFFGKLQVYFRYKRVYTQKSKKRWSDIALLLMLTSSWIRICNKLSETKTITNGF